MISVRPAPFSATVLKSRDPRLSDTKQTQADILLRRRYLSIIRHFFLTAPSSFTTCMPAAGHPVPL